MSSYSARLVGTPSRDDSDSSTSTPASLRMAMSTHKSIQRTPSRLHTMIEPFSSPPSPTLASFGISSLGMELIEGKKENQVKKKN